MPAESRPLSIFTNRERVALAAAVTPQTRLLSTLKTLLLWPLSLWAALTVATHLSQLAHVTFEAYVQYAVTLAVIVTVLAFITTRPSLLAIGGKDAPSLLVIAAVCLVGSALALLINHPADDDYFYLPNAIYFLHHPSSPMGFEIHFLFSGGQPFTSVFWATSGAYEYIQAAAAHALGVDFLTLYYVVTAAAVGFMIPFAVFLLLASFSDGIPSAVSGTLISIGAITLLGETPRTFGSHSLAHPPQGIVLVLAVILPLFALFTLDYFEKPTLHSWIAVFLLSTAGVGANSSAVFLLPALALTLAVAHLIAGPERSQVLRRLPAYFSAMFYLAIYGIFILANGAAQLDAASPANLNWPQDFVGHLQFLINPATPVTPVALVVTTCLGIALLRGKLRRLLAAWVVSACALFLNPLVAPFVIRFVTSPNAYWRMFYIYPFPLTIGIVASALYARLGRVSGTGRHVVLVLACVLLIGANAMLPQASILDGPQVELGFSRYKLPAKLVQSAQEVVAVAPRGPMLAPSLLGGTVVLLDPECPQVRIKKDALRVWLYARGQIQDAEARIKASDFLDGRPNGDFTALIEVLREHPEIRSIVVRRPVYSAEDVKALLLHRGFTSSKAIEGYVVAWKTP
jgi:hypothetical protein